MSSDNPFEFRRRDHVDEPGIVGASWWNEAVRAAGSAQTRRAILGVFAVAGGVLAVFGLGVATCSGDDDDDVSSRLEAAIEVQRDHGWRFGATDRALKYNGAPGTAVPFDRIQRVIAALAPKNSALAPFVVRTLLEAPEALPRKPVASPEEPTFVPFWHKLEAAERGGHEAYLEMGRGTGLALLGRPTSEPPPAGSAGALSGAARKVTESLSGKPASRPPAPASAPPASPPPASPPPALAPNGEALVVDLPGRASVAFAAGAAEWFEPVLLVDNWPHPLGVVPSHEVLAELVRFLPEFEGARERRPVDAPPLFLLASERLAPYSAEAEGFDNRYLAKLPGAATLLRLGVKRVNYVVASAQELPERADLNQDFVAYQGAGIEVRALTTYDANPLAAPPAYRPQARATSYSSGSSSEPDFGKVAVLVAVGTGLVIGARTIRSGSMNRSSGWSWGGG